MSSVSEGNANVMHLGMFVFLSVGPMWWDGSGSRLKNVFRDSSEIDYIMQSTLRHDVKRALRCNICHSERVHYVISDFLVSPV